MTAQLSEAVTTFFTGDSSGLVNAVKKGDDALAASARKERIVADYKLKIRKDLERAEALAPIKAKEAADKEAGVKIKAAKDAADKVIRQQKASGAANIAKELRDNFANNAKQKIGGALQNTLGLSEDAAEGLVGKLGRFAPYLTAAGAAGVALWKTFQAGNRFAAEQTQKMTALSGEMLRSSRINIFSSSSEGADSLSAKLETIRQQQREAKEAQRDNDPYGFGGGIVGNMKTAASQFQDSVRSQFGMSAYNDTDKQEDAKNTLILQQRLTDQQGVKLTKDRSDALSRELDLTRARLTLDQQTVAINDLQLQKEREMASARYATLSIDDQEKVKARFDVQMTAQEQLRTAMEQRYNMQLGIVSLQASALTADQQAYVAAEARVKQVREEIRTRKMNAEEQRSMLLAELTDLNTVRTAQRKAIMESPAARNRRFFNQERRATRQAKADARIDATDGLIDIRRDITGRITGGRDVVTGLLRPVSSSFSQSGGLRTGALRSGNLNGGGNDVNKGSTLISATRAIADAVDISNRYLENISRQLDNQGYA